MLTSARTRDFRLKRLLAACSVSIKPQMRRARPRCSNSCAVASPIPLLPRLIRIFFPLALPLSSFLMSGKLFVPL